MRFSAASLTVLGPRYVGCFARQGLRKQKAAEEAPEGQEEAEGDGEEEVVLEESDGDL